ncbi:MAG: DUF2804 domain-containing protein [Pseudomonadota bacterium]
MNDLVDKDGAIRFGLYPKEIGSVNYQDYRLLTPMGLPVPDRLKKILFNQFIFIGIIGPEYILGLAVIDLKYLSSGFLYVYDRARKNVWETKKISLLNWEAHIDPRPDKTAARFKSRKLNILMYEGNFTAWGKGIGIDAKLDLPSTRPLRICTRAGYRGWVYKQSTTPVPVSGRLRYRGRVVDMSPDSHLALIDWTAGFMRRETFWNWAATAARLPDGRTLGFNFSCGVNETSFTENYFLLDGRMTKVDTVDFIFDQRRLYRTWRIVSHDRKVDLLFIPQGHRSDRVNVLAVASRFTQLLGAFEGILTTDRGEKVKFDGLPGWAEDHYAKW